MKRVKKECLKFKKALPWYVITGPPSSGKTTLINELSKLGYLTYPEAARVIIDREMAKGKSIEEIRKNEAEFQKKVFRMNVEIERAAPKDKIVFFDRAIPDSIAYYQLYGLDPKEVFDACKKIRYKKVFFLEPLPFVKDYARIENGKTVEKLTNLLKENYKKLGYKIVTIPAMPVKERLNKILKEIKSD